MYFQEITEIWEMIIATFFALVVIGAIFMVRDPGMITSQTMSKEISYLATLKSNDDSTIKIKIPSELKTESKDNSISISWKNDAKYSAYYLGQTKTSQTGDYIILQ